MRIYALKKLKDDKKIKWREAYTDKSLFLKDQFEYVIGPKSYYRFEGKQTDGSGEWYVVIGPSGARDVEPKWFCGIRKLPDSWPAGGKKFDNIVDAFNYAFDTWGVPKPGTLPRYTASDLRRIGSKIEEFKKMREEQGEKPVEKGKFSTFNMYWMTKDAMSAGNVFRASLIWHGGEFEDVFKVDDKSNRLDPNECFQNLLKAAGFANAQEAEAELERLRDAAFKEHGNDPVTSMEPKRITQERQAADPVALTPVKWDSAENNWVDVAQRELDFEGSSAVGPRPAVPRLEELGIKVGRFERRFPNLGGASPIVVMRGIASELQNLRNPVSTALSVPGQQDIESGQSQDNPKTNAVVEFIFEGVPSVKAAVSADEGQPFSVFSVVGDLVGARDNTVAAWADDMYEGMASQRRLRLAALLAVAGRQKRRENLPISDELLDQQPEHMQELLRRSSFEEGIAGSVFELRRLRNQFGTTHIHLAEELKKEGGKINIPAHTFVEYSPRDDSKRLLYLSLYSSHKNFGQDYCITEDRLVGEVFQNVFVNMEVHRGSRNSRQLAARKAEAVRRYLHDAQFTVERRKKQDSDVSSAMGNNMTIRQINEVLAGVRGLSGVDANDELINSLRRIFKGGVVTLSLEGGPDGGPISVPVRTGSEKSLLYDALGGFWSGSIRVFDGLDTTRFPGALVSDQKRFDEIVINSSIRTVSSRELVDKIASVSMSNINDPAVASDLRSIVESRESWAPEELLEERPHMARVDILRLFGHDQNVSSAELVDRVSAVESDVEGREMSASTADAMIRGIEEQGRRHDRTAWKPSEFHNTFPRISRFDVINLFGSARPTNSMVSLDTLKKFIEKEGLAKKDYVSYMLSKQDGSAVGGQYGPGYRRHFLGLLKQRFGEYVSTADLSIFMSQYKGVNDAMFTGSQISNMVNGCLDLQGDRLEPVMNFLGSDFTVSTVGSARGAVQTPTINLTGAGYVRLFRGLMNGVWRVRDNFPELYERIMRTQMIPNVLAADRGFAQRWREIAAITDQDERLDRMDELVDEALAEHPRIPVYQFFGTMAQERQPEFQDASLLRPSVLGEPTPKLIEDEYNRIQGRVMGEMAKSLVLGSATLPGVRSDTPQYQELLNNLGGIDVRFNKNPKAGFTRVGVMRLSDPSNPESPREPTWDSGFQYDENVLLLDFQTRGVLAIPLSEVEGRRVCIYNLFTTTQRGDRRRRNEPEKSPNHIYEVTDWSQIGVGDDRPEKSVNKYADVFSSFYESVGSQSPFQKVSFKATRPAVAASARTNCLLSSEDEEGRVADRPVVDEMVTGARSFGDHVRLGLNGWYQLGKLPYKQTLERLGPQGAALTGEELGRGIAYQPLSNDRLRRFLHNVSEMQTSIRSFADSIDQMLFDAMRHDRENQPSGLVYDGRPWYDIVFASAGETKVRIETMGAQNATVEAVHSYIDGITGGDDDALIRVTGLRDAVAYEMLSDSDFQELFDLKRPYGADGVEKLRKNRILRRIAEGNTGDAVFALEKSEVPVRDVAEEPGSGAAIWNELVRNTTEVVNQVLQDPEISEQQGLADAEADRETEDETGILIEDDVDSDEVSVEEVPSEGGNTVTVVQDSPTEPGSAAPPATGGEPSAAPGAPSFEDILRMQDEELQGRRGQPAQEPAAPDAPPSFEDILRMQEEELRRRQEEQEETSDDGGNNRGSAALLGILKTAKSMRELGILDIAASLNEFVRDEIRAGTTFRRGILRRTASSLSRAAAELAREGKNDEAGEINRLANSYMEKYEKESGG